MSQVGHWPRVWAAAVLWSAVCLAQVNTATVYGTVTDPSGSAIPQAAVNAANLQTGGSWNTVTNAQGEYTLTFLPAGLYTITTKGAGFKESRNTGIELSGGQELRLKYALALGDVTETVTVSAETPLINTANAEQSLNLNLARVKELPTANRDWSSLLSLGAGMTVSNNAVSMNGLPQDGFRFTVDGANASGSGESETLTSLGYIKAVSLEAVREVTVTSGIAPAETGPTMSGNVNVITKSGTNDLHGSLFENNRTEDVAARNQFLMTRPPVTFNQFGGSIGGPILKNKLFYFGVYEGYRSRAFTAVSGNVPTGEFRALVTAANPAMKTFFDTFPLPNSSYAAGAVTGFYQSAASGVEDSNHYSMRGDYMMTDRDMFSVRYTYDTPFQLTPRVSPQNTRTFDVTTHKGVVSYIHSSAGYSAETRVGYNRFERARLDNIFTLGVSAITGSLGFSNSGELMENLGVNYSFDQIIALTRGRHSIKFGGLFQMYESGRNNETVPEFQFANANDLLANKPSQVTISFGVRPYTLRNWITGFFVQDDFRVSRNFMVNLGLRADWFSVPTEDSGRIFNRTGPFGIGPYTSSDSIYSGSKFDYSPRAGFAWTITPKTVIRAGSGIFTSAHNQFGGPVELIQNAIDEPNRVVFSAVEASRFGISYPTTNATVLPLVKGAGPISGTVIGQRFPQPSSIQWTMSVSREIGKTLSVETAYMGNHAIHANVVRRINQVNPLTGLRPYDGYSEYNYYDGSESTNYNAWQNTVRRRFSNGFQMGGMYSWARSMSYSNAANIGFPNPPQDSNNIRGDYGPSPFDIRHRFNIDYLYELPLMKLTGRTGRGARLLLGGWQFSGIYTAESGPPINLTQSTSYQSTRPDYIGGNAYTADASATLQFLNKAVFAKIPVGMANAPLHFGNIGRNALRAPGFWNLDMALAKNLDFTERYRLQLRADMFNSLNHTNFSGISTAIEAGNFGRFTSTRGARVMQFNARFSF
ncbi:TonB-dependent receptor domain-containing protein [Paludibaculum fermentans]|uniref:TonB-dependent receptor n=1 Tax=Paludibaculum fermentans TaxID=1473598 RepID=UPI003EB6ECD6